MEDGQVTKNNVELKNFMQEEFVKIKSTFDEKINRLKESVERNVAGFKIPI